MKKHAKIVYSVIVIVLGFMTIFTGCGKTDQASVPVEKTVENEEPSLDSVKDEQEKKEADSTPIYFELDGGTIAYKDYEYVEKGFYAHSDGDSSHTIVVNFDYTNKEDSPKNYTADFWINAFQNGKALDGPSGYSPDWAPESYLNAYENVLKGTTITVGAVFTLQDYSPVTIIVNHNGGMEESNPMLLEIEPYEDTSFNIDLLYGLWEDQNSDKELTLTSDAIWLGKGGSGSTSKGPSMWTDENMFHTSFSKIGDLYIDQSGDNLRMYNDEYDFIQLENWSEENAEEVKEPEKINLGDSIKLDFAEILFETYDVKDEIKETANLVTSSGGSGGNIDKVQIIESAKAGTKYLVINGTIKNLSSSVLSPKNMKAKLILNNESEISCKVSLIDGNASNISTIEPMNEAKIILNAGISEDMLDSINTVTWEIGFNEKFSHMGSDDLSTSKYHYLINTVGTDEK